MKIWNIGDKVEASDLNGNFAKVDISESINNNETLGEDLDSGVAYFKQADDNSVGKTSTNSGDSSGNDWDLREGYWQACDITGLESSVEKIRGVTFNCNGVSVAGDITVDLYEGENTSVLTASLLGSVDYNISTTGNKVITFASPIVIDSSQPHFFVFRTAGSTIISCSILNWNSNVSPSKKWYSSTNQGTSWTEGSYQDDYTYSVVTLLADHIYEENTNFPDGFTQEAGSDEDTVSCIQEGIATISGVDERSRYGLTGSNGAIEAKSDGVCVGMSMKDNELLIMKNI